MLATEVVILTFWVVVLTLLFMQALRMVLQQTLTISDGYSYETAPSTKIGRNVGTCRRFRCLSTLFAVTVAMVCGHCYGADGQWISLVDCPSESFPVYDMEKNYERAIYFYQMDNSPALSRNLLEGILENLGITRYVVNMGYQYGNSVTPPPDPGPSFKL